jgi:transcription elongation factor GreB
MSKAFTSEEAPDPGPLGRTVPRLAPGEVRYVTPEGQAALRAALEAARADPMPAARTRAALLEATLATLTVLDGGTAPAGEAAFGRWVTVEDDAGVRATWRLVGPDEADARRGLISVSAPVARALLGRCAGEQVEVERPDGAKRFTLVAVRDSAPSD